MDPLKTLTVLTYNIDRRSVYIEDRFNALIKQIKETKPTPEVIFIQEGSRDIYSKLFLVMKNMGYRWVFFPEIQNRACGEIIFTKLSILDKKYMRFQHTDQERGLSVYTVEASNQKIVIATTQLETGTPLLRKQLLQISSIFSSYKEPVILAGDFQITSFCVDLDKPEGWTDAWEEAGKSSEEFTVDKDKNTLAEVQDRPDRVWYRGLDCDDCRLVGLPAPRKEIYHPSKHFGVQATFILS